MEISLLPLGMAFARAIRCELYPALWAWHGETGPIVIQSWCAEWYLMTGPIQSTFLAS